jgi:hypothetical protein
MQLFPGSVSAQVLAAPQLGHDNYEHTLSQLDSATESSATM